TLTFFFFNNTATTDTHTLSLHDALPISFGLREPELLAHHIRAEHHRDHLIARMPASHALAPHAAVGRNDQPLGGNVLERLANERSEEHTSELQSPYDLVCRLLLEKKKKQ